MRLTDQQTAVLYIRVSTDEQALGYSLKHQQEQLERYCTIRNIKVLGLYTDDASAKSFARPAFQDLLGFVKASKGTVDLLLVVKWDRFSRNTADAFSMKRQLMNLGCSVQAVEQPLDESVPEHKLMLALYLAQPEVENDRRSLNTRAGMRKAMREGRWMSTPPLGYSSHREGNSKPFIRPNEDRHLISRAFYLISTSRSPIEHIRKQLYSEGLKCSRSNFYRLLKQVAYIGKISVPAWGKEPGEIVTALHEPIVDEQVFYAVQERLDTKTLSRVPSAMPTSDFPLKGSLTCSRCKRTLTASHSQGNGGKYAYYHCQKGCKERIRVKDADSALQDHLEQLKVAPEILELYDVVLHDLRKANSAQRTRQIKKLQDQLENAEELMRLTDERFVLREIERDSYERVKKGNRLQVAKLTRELIGLREEVVDIVEDFRLGINLLANLPDFYRNVDIEGKQRILSSIYPQKLTFENGKYRTNGENRLVTLISKDSNNLQAAENRKTLELEGLSSIVTRTGFEPVQPP